MAFCDSRSLLRGFNFTRLHGAFVAKLSLAIGLAFGLVSSAGGRTAAAQDLPVFKSSVAVVPISAVVHDRRGRVVTTLKASDFEVFDNGERRSILDFMTDQSSPITLAVLVDTSGSMRVGPKMAVAREVLKSVAADLQDGRDEVSVFTFDAALHEELAFTANPKALNTALDAADPFGVTSLYDAIAETARRLGTRPAQRRAVIVLTDGEDTSSALTAAEVSGLASAIDTPVYVVATVPPIDYAIHLDRSGGAGAAARSDLRDLAVWTGGNLRWVTAGEQATLAAREIVNELRHQYLIMIEPSGGQAWRPLELRLKDRRMTVRARSGYFGTRSDSSQ